MAFVCCLLLVLLISLNYDFVVVVNIYFLVISSFNCPDDSGILHSISVRVNDLSSSYTIKWRENSILRINLKETHILYKWRENEIINDIRIRRIF